MRVTRVGRVETGLDVLLRKPSLLRGARAGLIANPASVSKDLVHGSVLLKKVLVALFGPEHGVWGNAQDLVELGDGRDSRTGLPIHSLYGMTRVPTEAMLAGIDTLVVDLQDVGARYYTYAYTMLHALEAGARFGKRVVVLDRPNPLGGVRMEGNVLLPDYRSFVGLHPLPVRHGMTIGELARLFRSDLQLDVKLEVIPMKGWRREMSFEETGLPWVQPSPNMPTPDTAFVYPGGCLLEGTNLSEGRGTTRPFELMGAPWIDPFALARDMSREAIPGVRFRPVFFTPTFQKHQGQVCGGVQVHVQDRRSFSPYLAYLLLIEKARSQNTRLFQWRDPPYEYEFVKRPFDILCGTDGVRHAIEKGASLKALARSWTGELKAFARRRKPHLLY